MNQLKILRTIIRNRRDQLSAIMAHESGLGDRRRAHEAELRREMCETFLLDIARLLNSPPPPSPVACAMLAQKDPAWNTPTGAVIIRRGVSA